MRDSGAYYYLLVIVRSCSLAEYCITGVINNCRELSGGNRKGTGNSEVQSLLSFTSGICTEILETHARFLNAPKVKTKLSGFSVNLAQIVRVPKVNRD